MGYYYNTKTKIAKKNNAKIKTN